jgi:tocopherol O-methyltransferase
MIACPTVQKNEIKSHYDLATFFYRLLWGEHIHHGLWDADETPEVAQRQLIDRQIAAAGIQPGARVLDVGCGMGATSIYLARTLGCDVTGVTLSPLQRWWATVSAILKGVPKRTRFIQGDAEKVELPPRSFDVVWSVECTEHLYDKPRFFRRAAASQGRIIRRFARRAGQSMDLFVKRFETILRAYRTRAMKYGCFVAQL